MTNSDYEQHYNFVYGREYDKIIAEFSNKFEFNDQGHSVEKRIDDFWSDLLIRRDSFFRVKITQEMSKEDLFCTNLLREFKNRMGDYQKNQFFVKFAEIEIPKIKEIVIKNKCEIIKPDVYNATIIDLYGYLASYYAVNKLIEEFPGVDYRKTEDKDEFIRIWKTDPDLRMKSEKQHMTSANDKPLLTYWTGGENKTQFVQLIYALHEAKLLNNGRGEITNIVDELGQFLGVELPETWQQNLSKSINSANNNHIPPIFDKIKQAFLDYSKKRLDKNDNKK